MSMTKDQEQWGLYRVFINQANRLQAQADSFRASAKRYEQWAGKPCPPDAPEPVCTCIESPNRYCQCCGH
jgi:hypothetical protein